MGQPDTPILAGGPKEATTSRRAPDDAPPCARREMQLMLAGIAHEVRNPLGARFLCASKRPPEDDPRRKHVAKIAASHVRARRQRLRLRGGAFRFRKRSELLRSSRLRRWRTRDTCELPPDHRTLGERRHRKINARSNPVRNGFRQSNPRRASLTAACTKDGEHTIEVLVTTPPGISASTAHASPFHTT